MIKYFTFSHSDGPNRYVGDLIDLDSEFFDTTSLDGKHSSHVLDVLYLDRTF